MEVLLSIIGAHAESAATDMTSAYERVDSLMCFMVSSWLS